MVKLIELFTTTGLGWQKRKKDRKFLIFSVDTAEMSSSISFASF